MLKEQTQQIKPSWQLNLWSTPHPAPNVLYDEYQRIVRSDEIVAPRPLPADPLIAGGCGHSAKDVKFSAWAVTVCLVIGAVVVGLAGVIGG